LLLLLWLLCALRLGLTILLLCWASLLLLLLPLLLPAFLLPVGLTLLIALLVVLRVYRNHRAEKQDAGGTGHSDKFHGSCFHISVLSYARRLPEDWSWPGQATRGVASGLGRTSS
jgi:hypothetical protein